MPPSKASAAKKQPLTLAQLAAYDDLLTDALVDHAYYWTIVPKNRTSYHPSRGVREEEIAKILQDEIVLNKDLDAAQERLLGTDGIKKFCNGLKTPKERDDFKLHMRRYLQIYLPDCPFEINSTNRYTIVTHEASISARRYIKKHEKIKYLSGTQVVITPEEEREMTARKKDFSIIISARNKCSSLFMGPARLANHDCNANAKLMTTGQAGIEIIAIRDIEVGEEITVTYADNYFGEDNCECLCVTCEHSQVNGWASEDGQAAVKHSIEEEGLQGYSLRRRRKDDRVGSLSRTPSVTPDIRPRILKTKPSGKLGRGSLAIQSPVLGDSLTPGKKRVFDTLATPPVTPAKKLKTLDADEASPLPLDLESSRGSSIDQSARRSSLSSAGNGDSAATDITEPEKDTPEPLIHSPKPTPLKHSIQVLKQEESEDSRGDALSSMVSFPAPSTDVKVMTGRTISLITPKAIHQTSTTVVRSIPISFLCETPPPSTPESSTSAPEPVQEEPTAVVITSTELTERMITTSESPQKRRYQRRTFVKQATPPARVRVPGDYTLTPLLLSEPETAWVRCTICDTAFVQRNAYYTRSSCPRCERHSKLYGFTWPKTEPAGPRDKEERILDHRIIHRFLDAEDEAKIRGRKMPAWFTARKEKESEDREADVSKQKLLKKRTRRSDINDEEGEDDVKGLRRSGRMRRASLRVTTR